MEKNMTPTNEDDFIKLVDYHGNDDLFRQKYVSQMTEDDIELIKNIKSGAQDLFNLIGHHPYTRNLSISVQCLEEFVMHAVKGITEKYCQSNKRND